MPSTSVPATVALATALGVARFAAAAFVRAVAVFMIFYVPRRRAVSGVLVVMIIAMIVMVVIPICVAVIVVTVSATVSTAIAASVTAAATVARAVTGTGDFSARDKPHREDGSENEFWKNGFHIGRAPEIGECSSLI